MQMTQGALGFLLKRYSAVLRKCRALNLLGSLVLAGALTAGAASLAVADTVNWSKPEVTIATGTFSGGGTNPFAPNKDNTGHWGQNVTAETLTISGGSLTLENSNRVVHYNNNDPSSDIKGMAVTMTGGTLTIKTDTQNTAPNFDFSSLDVNTFDLSGGAVTLTGNDSNGWEKAAYIGAYNGMKISGAGTTVTMNKNSELFAGDYLHIEGGSIDMQGDTTAGGFNAKAAHIWFADTGDNSISGGTITVDENGYGVMSAPVLNMSGGKLDVKGSLLLQPKAGASNNIVYAGANTGIFNLSDGAVVVEEDGAFYAPQTQINQTGGTLTVNGILRTDKFGSGYLCENSGYTLSGGTLVIEGNAAPNGTANNGIVQVGTLNIQSGTVTIGLKGNRATNTSWDAGPFLGGELGTTMSGGTVTLGDYGELYGGTSSWSKNDGTASNEMNLSGGAIVMNGSAVGKDSLLYAASHKDWDNSGNKNFVALNIKDSASITVNAGKFGCILARQTNMTGGTITVDGTLTVAGGAKKGNNYTVDSGILNVAHKGGTFTLSGGTVRVADGGALDFATGKVDMVLTGNGVIDYQGGSSGKLAFNDLTLAGGTLNGVTALTVAASAAANGVSAATLNVGDSNNAHNLDLTTLNQTGGAVNVNNGNLTVDTLNQTGGTLTVGGAGAVGTLKVKTSLCNVNYTASTAGILVANQGVLEAGKDILLASNFTPQTGVSKIQVAAGGTLKINGLPSIKKENLDTIKTNLLNDGTRSKGLLDLGDTTITDLVTNGEVKFDDAASAGVENADTLAATVTDASNSQSLTGGYNKVETSNSIKTEDGTLQLAGNVQGGNIVENPTNGTAAPVTVGKTGANGNAALTLGVADANNSGKVGAVTLTTNTAGSSATLNAVGNGEASFTTGDITASGTGTTEVNASGASLNSGAIGSSTAKVGTVHAADNGSVNSTGAIYAANVNADNGGNVTSGAAITAGTLSAKNGGTVQANGDISVTSAVTGLNNGTIRSDTGDVALDAGATNASGAIVAVEGDITANGQNIVAADGKDLTLSAEKGTITAADITATSLAAKKLNAGAVSVTNGSLTATGTGTDASSVNSLALDNAQGQVGDLTVATTASLNNGASLNADTLTMSGDLTVGSDADSTGGTTLVVDALDLAGNALLIDPAWGLASNNVAVGSLAGVGDTDRSLINGKVGVGRNSMAAIGTTDTGWLAGHVNAVTNGAGLTENGVDSALGIHAPQVLKNTMGITVDGTKAAIAVSDIGGNQLNFSGKSLLVVNADAALAPAGALSAQAATTANIADGAKLRIAGAEVGKTYTVLGTNINTNSGGTVNLTPGAAWSNANFSTDSPMVTGGVFDAATGAITTSLVSAHKVFPLLDSELADVVDAGYLNHEIGPRHVNADAPGARFLSRATSRDYLGNDAEQAAVTMESAARMALIGAVPQMTLAANNAAGTAVTQRTSLAQPGGNALQSMASDGSVSGASASEVAKSGFALWIMPLYQSANGWGLEGGNFDLNYNGGLGGVAIGADYTFENAIRAGITFNIGGGYATGSGDFNETTNDMSFWGIGAYAGWTKNNFGLTADVNYTSTYNKLEQELPAAMQMDSLKSDVTAWAISAGLRGEYKIETSVLDITPHVGVRYTSLNTDEYDVKSGGTVLSGDGISQSIWTFPVGVAFSKEIETGNGWRVKPSLDLAVIPAAGDIEARGDVRFTGVSGTAELETQTMDYISYMGQAGLEFGNDTVSFGVNYNLQTGVHSTSHGVFGTFRYEF